MSNKMYVSFESLRTVVERHEQVMKDFKITLATIYEARDLDIERGIEWFNEPVTSAFGLTIIRQVCSL
jgi:hypothetical protein